MRRLTLAANQATQRDNARARLQKGGGEAPRLFERKANIVLVSQITC